MANSNAMSSDEMQSKIQTARRDAESLKDRIKRKKDDLQDTSRKLHWPLARSSPRSLRAASPLPAPGADPSCAPQCGASPRATPTRCRASA